MKRIVLAVALFVVSAGAGPCERDSKPAVDGLLLPGVVHQGMGPECPNVWRVDTQDGRKLWPVEDKAFQVEGLEVAFLAHEQQGMVSICMAGTMVKFDQMQKR